MLKMAGVKEFNQKFQEYLKSKSEPSILALNSQLSQISISLDLSIFSPLNSEASKLYLSLYHLLNDPELNNTNLILSIVAVLRRAAEHLAARDALVHKYRLCVVLSKHVSKISNLDHFKNFMTLLAALTSGIVLNWHDLFVNDLIPFLIGKLRLNNCTELHQIYLIILINLCYRNTPAIYALCNTVKMDELMGFFEGNELLVSVFFF